jgi:hypothetical protein
MMAERSADEACHSEAPRSLETEESRQFACVMSADLKVGATRPRLRDYLSHLVGLP